MDPRLGGANSPGDIDLQDSAFAGGPPPGRGKRNGTRRGVDPRLGGANLVHCRESDRHQRWTPAWAGQTGRSFHFTLGWTPAWAGQTIPLPRASIPLPVDPRLGGANFGRSQRHRRRPAWAGHVPPATRCAERWTPAWAGQTAPGALGGCRHEVEPGRGLPCLKSYSAGGPPPGRGKSTLPISPRWTPAWAGQTLGGSPAPIRVDPRLGGANWG